MVALSRGDRGGRCGVGVAIAVVAVVVSGEVEQVPMGAAQQAFPFPRGSRTTRSCRTRSLASVFPVPLD
jgi:hypothetical protein